jgi:hypothetical protein
MITGGSLKVHEDTWEKKKANSRVEEWQEMATIR